MEPANNNFSLKGEELFKKADKKLKGSFFGNLFGSKSERIEQAEELYKQAATNFKLAKRWEDAANCYTRIVDCEKANKTGEAAEYLVEAANMWKKINSAECIKFLEQAVVLYCQENRIGYAAKLKKQIAEIYEQDYEFTLALKHYQEAADLFYAENDSSSDYNNTRLKVAELCVSQAEVDYVKAIKIFEEVGDKYLENKLTEPSAKNLYFKACLCFLANEDTVGCNLALEKYLEKSPSFNNTRQSKFIAAISKCLEENNVQQFSEECYQYNQIIPLDKWQTTVLNKVKEKMGKGNVQVNNQDPDIL